MRTLELLTEDSRKALRESARAVIERVFPAGELDAFEGIRKQLGELEEHFTAAGVEAIVPIAANVYTVPPDMLRVRCVLEEDGLGRKGTNIVGKVTAFLSDENWLAMLHVSGKNVELVCLEPVSSGCAAPRPAKKAAPAAETQAELPNVDVPLETLYHVCDAAGNPVHDNPMPQAAAEAQLKLVAENLPKEHAEGLQLVAWSPIPALVNDAYAGEDDSENDADDDSEPENVETTPEYVIGLLRGPNANAEDAYGVLRQAYERAEEDGGDTFADALGEKQEAFLAEQMRHDDCTVLQALVMQLEENDYTPDALTWLCATAYSLCQRDYDGEDPAGATLEEKIEWAIENYRPYLFDVPLTMVLAWLEEKYIEGAAPKFEKVYLECFEQNFPDFRDVIEENATLLRNEMNRVPTGVIGALSYAVTRNGYEDNCRWTVAAAVALAARIFPTETLLDSVKLAMGEYSRVGMKKTRAKKTAAV